MNQTTLILSRRPDIVVAVRDVAPEHAARVEAIITRFSEPHPLPVVTADGARSFVFRFAPLRDEPFADVASAAHPCGSITIRAVENFLPDDAGVKRHELAPLTQPGADRLKTEFGYFLADIEPPAPRAEWRPPAVRVSGEPLLYGKTYAQFVLNQNGYQPATSSGETPPRVGTEFNADADEARALSPMCVNVPASLAVVELDWAVNPAAAEAYAAAGVAPRGAETAAGIEARIVASAGSGLVATRREETRVTLVFANTGRVPFAEQYDVRRAPRRDDGQEIPNAAVRVKCRTHGAPLDISAADAYSVDFTTMKYSELASLSGVKFSDALAEVESWLRAGAGLDQPTASAETAEPVTRGRGRKAAAAA